MFYNEIRLCAQIIDSCHHNYEGLSDHFKREYPLWTWSSLHLYSHSKTWNYIFCDSSQSLARRDNCKGDRIVRNVYGVGNAHIWVIDLNHLEHETHSLSGWDSSPPCKWVGPILHCAMLVLPAAIHPITVGVAPVMVVKKSPPLNLGSSLWAKILWKACLCW